MIWNHGEVLLFLLTFIIFSIPTYLIKVYSFYPRPVLASGYCRYMRLSLCVCVRVCMRVCARQPLPFPRDNLTPAQARINKFGSKVQSTLVKLPIVFGVDWA